MCNRAEQTTPATTTASFNVLAEIQVGSTWYNFKAIGTQAISSLKTYANIAAYGGESHETAPTFNTEGWNTIKAKIAEMVVF